MMIKAAEPYRMRQPFYARALNLDRLGRQKIAREIAVIGLGLSPREPHRRLAGFADALPATFLLRCRRMAAHHVRHRSFRIEREDLFCHYVLRMNLFAECTRRFFGDNLRAANFCRHVGDRSLRQRANVAISSIFCMRQNGSYM